MEKQWFSLFVSVHEDQDDDGDMEKIKLFPNHVSFCDGSRCHDSLRIPPYVADPINPNIVQKPHYPKELVYADDSDRSMEEIRAQLYLKRYVLCKDNKKSVSWITDGNIIINFDTHTYIYIYKS